MNSIAAPRNALRVADEVAVVACAMAGDDDPYGVLVRRRQNPIRQLFRSLCRDPALAEDLAETFLQTLSTVDTVKAPAACARLAARRAYQRLAATRG